MNARLRHWALLAACAWLPCAAGAEMLHYEFAGTVTSATALARPGDPVTGSFSLDSSAPTVGSCLWNACGYHDRAGAITMSVGSHRMSAAGTRIAIQNDQGLAGFEDAVHVSSGAPVRVDGRSYAAGSLMLSLVASTPQALDGTALPLAYEVQRFDMVREGGFSSGAPGRKGPSVYFRIDAIRLVRPAAH